MDAAEPMFARHGVAGVSMRQIAAAAGVDLSLVLYHFDSKDVLYRAVISRVMLEFNTRRIGLLEDLQRSNPDPSAVQLFDLQITAWLEIRFGPAPHRTRLIVLRNRIDLDVESPPPSDHEWPGDDFARNFVAALLRAQAHREPEYVHWSYHCLIGAIVYFMNSGARVERISGSYCDIRSQDAMRAALIRQVHNAFSD